MLTINKQKLAVALSLALATTLSTASLAKDGTYKAEEQGIWNTPIEAVVVIDNGKISSLTFNHKETPTIGGAALDRLKTAMLESQSSHVNAITGATVSSLAAIKAVAKALEKAEFKDNATGKNIQKAYSDGNAEVVVIGGGSGGMMAAVDLIKAGKKVILLESQGVLGGNSQLASTSFKGGGSSVQARLNIPKSSVEDFEKYLAKDPKASPEMAHAVASVSPGIVDYFVKGGADLNRVFLTFSHGATDGSTPGGQIVPVLVKDLDNLKADYRLNNKAVEILMNNGRVAGVKVEQGNGQPYIIKTDNVILATGGFAAGKDLIKKYAPKLATLGTTNTPGTLGEGQVMAEKVGAQLNGMENVTINPATYNTGKNHLSFTPIRYKSIMVNADGVRFADESSSDKNKTMDAMMKASGGSGVAYLIFDQGSMDQMAVAKDYLAKGYIKKADTLDRLAKELGINATNLQKTVDSYKQYVANGKDPDLEPRLSVANSTRPRTMGRP